MKKPYLLDQLAILSAHFGVEVPNGVYTQAGSPSERQQQQNEALAEFLLGVNQELGLVDKPSEPEVSPLDALVAEELGPEEVEASPDEGGKGKKKGKK